MGDFVDYSVSDGVAVLTMNDPDNRNAMSGASLADMASAITRLDNDDSVRAAVLTGAGTAFSAGANLKRVNEDFLSRTALQVQTFYREGMHQVVNALTLLETPLIAAVNGPAYGGGFIISCLCDVRIASQSATFCEVFVKMGVISGGGGAWIVPRIIGPSNYSLMAFTGEPVDAERALAMGLVSEVVSAADLMDRARTLAHRIAANSTPALRAMKRLILDARKSDLDSHLHLCAATTAVLHTDEDHKEAITARGERRPPRFKGH
jgi:enoyl-CoA hydratase/carnithine racemase